MLTVLVLGLILNNVTELSVKFTLTDACANTEKDGKSNHNSHTPYFDDL
jgi:hypothetical protein